MLIDWLSTAEHLKSHGLTKQEQSGFWYLFIVATASTHRRQGLAGATLQRVQEEARKDGKALWLESTSPTSRDLYARHGFKVVQEVVLGKGQVGTDGLRKKGGEGVSLWGMVWRP